MTHDQLKTEMLLIAAALVSIQHTEPKHAAAKLPEIGNLGRRLIRVIDSYRGDPRSKRITELEEFAREVALPPYSDSDLASTLQARAVHLLSQNNIDNAPESV
jgi:hypothetical protein